MNIRYLSPPAHLNLTQTSTPSVRFSDLAVTTTQFPWSEFPKQRLAHNTTTAPSTSTTIIPMPKLVCITPALTLGGLVVAVALNVDVGAAGRLVILADVTAPLLEVEVIVKLPIGVLMAVVPDVEPAVVPVELAVAVAL